MLTETSSSYLIASAGLLMGLFELFPRIVLLLLSGSIRMLAEFRSLLLIKLITLATALSLVV